MDQKIPELNRTLGMVSELIAANDQPEPSTTTFELSDTLYATASLDKTDQVYIWLGVSTTPTPIRPSPSI